MGVWVQLVNTSEQVDSIQARLCTEAKVSHGHKLASGSASLESIYAESYTTSQGEAQVQKAPSRNRASG